MQLPDVEQTLRAIRAPPTGHRADGTPVYALPVIVDHTRSSGTPEIVVGAGRIAEYLDTRFPTRPAFPVGTRSVQMVFVHWMMQVWVRPVLAVMVPASYEDLGDRSRNWVGPAGAVPRGGSGTRDQWEEVRRQFDFLAGVLDRGDGDGTVMMGNEVTYADFALCSLLIWIKRVGPPGAWEMVRALNGGRWQRLWDSCRGYMDEH